MTYALTLALSAGLFATSGVATYAQNEHTVYAGKHTKSVWANRVSNDLSGKLEYPNTPTSGFVSVRFECGPDGKPINIVVVNHSHSRFDAKSIRAVRSLRSLHPLPTSIKTGQKMQANLIFATNEYQLSRQALLLERAEATRLSASQSEQTVLVLSSSSRSPG